MNKNSTPLLLLILLWLAACTTATPTAVSTQIAIVEIEDVEKTAVFPTNTPIPSATPTPIPTVMPTETPTTVPTATATSTTQPTSTGTPIPTPTNPSGVVTELPDITHDLLVIADGSLKVWNQATGNIEILIRNSNQQSEVGSITRFRVDDEGENLVAARLINDSPPTFTLILLDLKSKETLDLVVEIPYLLDFELSPDGRQLVYTVGDAASIKDGDNYPYRGEIYVQDIELIQPPYRIGTCTNITTDGEERTRLGCLGTLWSPDSQQLLWADVRGIWEYKLNTIISSLLQPSDYNIDGGFEVNAFMLIDWSPSGRYVRLDVGHYEGGNESILDLQSGKLIEIPYTFAYEGPVLTSVSWMQDDQIFMVRTGGRYSDFTNYAEFWHIQPEQGMLTLEQSINIPTGPDAYISEATQLTDGSLAFAVFSYEDVDKTTGLYRFDPHRETPQKVNNFPSQIDYTGTIYWTPNGDGALIVWYQDPQSSQYTGISYDFMYVNPNDALFYYIRPLFGQSIMSNKGDLQIMWSN